jgi:hypothetical protein
MLRLAGRKQGKNMDKASALDLTRNHTEMDYGPNPSGSIGISSEIVLAMDCILMPHDLEECRGPALTPAASRI